MSLLNHSFNLLTLEVQVTRFKWNTYIYDFLNKFTYCTTVKHHKMAVCSHHHTVISLGFGNMALLQYGQHLYSTVFCTAITVYSMVESMMSTFLKGHKFSEIISQHPNFLGNLWEPFLPNSDASWQ